MLVVDDERDVRQLVAMIVETGGRTAVTAENGRRALDLLGEEAFDVIVLDVMMPVVDGWGVLEGMAGLERRPPVIVLSAHCTNEDRVRAFELGAVDFVDKPFDPDHLDRVIERIAMSTADELERRRQDGLREARSG